MGHLVGMSVGEWRERKREEESREGLARKGGREGDEPDTGNSQINSSPAVR